MGNGSEKANGVVRQLGKRIRELRTVHRRGRMTQEDLAERAEISVSFLSMIERGERSPHIETLAHLAKALEVELYELFAGPRVELARAAEEPDAHTRAVMEFVRRHALTKREVDKLLSVARTLFPR
jgi:transcriptional regulator with XRE-family HTH domain